MSKDSQQEIEKQRQEVFQGDFRVNLHEACTIGNGIVRIESEEEEVYLNAFNELNNFPSFFIPASGSGSRMFQFLYEWLDTKVETEMVSSFFSKWDDLALAKTGEFYSTDKESLVRQLLCEFSEKPKGLIPFHSNDLEIRTAFQEHVLQAQHVSGDRAAVHFTVQEESAKAIDDNIKELGSRAEGIQISYSHQKSETNAYCFDENEQLVKRDDIPLRRPAGHGALLNNLNDLKSETILIKNIDNIQHESKAEESEKIWQLAVGLMLEMKRELKNLVDNFTIENLNNFNSKYQIFSEDEMSQVDDSNIAAFVNRPTRVCGMVKNEGEPGGGPFWIEDNGSVSKQIVEKAQIKTSIPEQLKIVQESSHFNPVFIAVSKSDLNGKMLDLMTYRDDSKFFVVNKTHHGSPIAYRELPGLWNGSMSNWNTVFLEIPSDVFSPVKTVLDLVKSAHQQ